MFVCFLEFRTNFIIIKVILIVLSALLTVTLLCFYYAGQTLGFVPAMSVVVVGHYSLSGRLLKEHFNFTTETPMSNFFNCKYEIADVQSHHSSILAAIIGALSYEGHCIIDATNETG